MVGKFWKLRELRPGSARCCEWKLTRGCKIFFTEGITQMNTFKFFENGVTTNKMLITAGKKIHGRKSEG